MSQTKIANMTPSSLKCIPSLEGGNGGNDLTLASILPHFASGLNLFITHVFSTVTHLFPVHPPFGSQNNF